MTTKSILPISLPYYPNTEVSLVRVVGTQAEVIKYDHYLFVLNCAVLAQMTKEEIEKTILLVSTLRAQSFQVSVALLNTTSMDATQFINAFNVVLCFTSVTQAVLYTDGPDSKILKIFIGHRIYLGLDDYNNHIVSIGLKGSPLYGANLETPVIEIVSALTSLISPDHLISGIDGDRCSPKMFLPFISLNMPREFIRVVPSGWSDYPYFPRSSKEATAEELEQAKKIAKNAKKVYRGKGTPEFLCICPSTEQYLSLLLEQLQ